MIRYINTLPYVSLSVLLFQTMLGSFVLHPALLLGAFPSTTSDLIYPRGRREHCVTE